MISRYQTLTNVSLVVVSSFLFLGCLAGSTCSGMTDLSAEKLHQGVSYKRSAFQQTVKISFPWDFLEPCITIETLLPAAIGIDSWLIFKNPLKQRVQNRISLQAFCKVFTCPSLLWTEVLSWATPVIAPACTAPAHLRVILASLKTTKGLTDICEAIWYQFFSISPIFLDLSNTEFDSSFQAPCPYLRHGAWLRWGQWLLSTVTFHLRILKPTSSSVRTGLETRQLLGIQLQWTWNWEMRRNHSLGWECQVTFQGTESTGHLTR